MAFRYLRSAPNALSSETEDLNHKTKKNVVSLLIVAVIIALTVVLVITLDKETNLLKGLDKSNNATVEVTVISTHSDKSVEFVISDGESTQALPLNPMEAVTCGFKKKWTGDPQLTVTIVCNYTIGDLEKTTDKVVTVRNGDREKLSIYV